MRKIKLEVTIDHAGIDHYLSEEEAEEVILRQVTPELLVENIIGMPGSPMILVVLTRPGVSEETLMEEYLHMAEALNQAVRSLHFFMASSEGVDAVSECPTCSAVHGYHQEGCPEG